jgi:hypothetical protein
MVTDCITPTCDRCTREGELHERTANRRRIDGVWADVIIVAVVVLIVGFIAAKMRLVRQHPFGS